MSQIIKGLFTF